MATRRMLLVCLALAALGVTSGCATSFLYDRADRLANRWAGGYLELEPGQQALLDQRLAELHLWHRREQLPVYADWLRHAAARLENGAPLSRADMRDLGADLGVLWRELGGAAVPLLAELGAHLADEQVDGLLETLRAEHDKQLQAAARRPDGWHQQRRARSMERFLRRWTGSLTAGQRASLHQWAADLEPSHAASFENRAGWIEALASALEQRADTELLVAAAETLFVTPTSRWSPEYEALVERNAAKTTAFLVDFLNGLEDRQRQRAIARLDALAEQFEQLSRVGA